MKRLTTKEAIEHFKINEKTLRAWQTKGKVQSEMVGNRRITLVPENDEDRKLLSLGIDIPQDSMPSSDLDEAHKLEAIARSLLSAAKANKERMEIEGLLQKPEVLAKLELQLAEKERELTEKESVIKLWEADLKDKTSRWDEYIEGLEADQKEADETRDKYNQLLEDIKEREQALYNLTISAQNSMNEATAKLYEIKSVYATADELMAMLDRVWGYVSAWVNASSDKEKKIQTQFVMGWLPEAKQLYRKLKNQSL